VRFSRLTRKRRHACQGQSLVETTFILALVVLGSWAALQAIQSGLQQGATNYSNQFNGGGSSGGGGAPYSGVTYSTAPTQGTAYVPNPTPTPAPSPTPAPTPTP
jgi:hypothetical protein